MSTQVFASATTAFVDLVQRLGDDGWDAPGLGDWDLRALVGHTSHSFLTVSTYLRAPADREDVVGPADYYAKVRDYVATASAGDILERGRQAGRELGNFPAATVARLAAQALTDVAAAGDPLITVIGGAGIRLSNYLPTRVFELTVHGLDVARAAGVDFTPPQDALTEATALAAEIAVLLGSGAPVLRALTGRGALPPDFSVV